MLASASYVCPIRGLAGLEPPEPARLLQAAKVAKGLGIERLMLPVLEESLMGTKRAKVGFLDGLINALDRVAEAGVTAWLIAPAQSVLGLNWAPAHLVRAVRDPEADPVFVEGRVRNLRPLNWWENASIVQKRIEIFRELVAAISGHPAITGWVVLDRALEWSRPDLEAADLVLKSFMAEIRERNETAIISIGLGWSELLDPELVLALVRQVDGVRISGCEMRPPGLNAHADLAGELMVASYLGTMARWLFGRPTEVEIGWGMLDGTGDTEQTMESFKRLAGQGLAGAHWVSLIDPEPRLRSQPPWVLRPGLERVGLIDQGLEPKEHVETWLKQIRSGKPKDGVNDFIDISKQEYLDDPQTHLPRLWDHFRE